MKNINTIKISQATTEDAEGIQELVAKSSIGMYKLCGWSEKEIIERFNPERIKEGANKLKKSIESFTEEDILLVAKDEDNKIIGCCFGNKDENINRIEAMYILKEFQGSGLAQKLYETVYKMLNPKNDTFLDVFSLNLRGINFYKKMGFIETGKKTFEERFTNSDGNILEITEMKLKK
jgi:ribosomal protein S18 acetylase RimI-like enzyme